MPGNFTVDKKRVSFNLQHRNDDNSSEHSGTTDSFKSNHAYHNKTAPPARGLRRGYRSRVERDFEHITKSYPDQIPHINKNSPKPTEGRSRQSYNSTKNNSYGLPESERWRPLGSFEEMLFFKNQDSHTPTSQPLHQRENNAATSRHPGKDTQRRQNQTSHDRPSNKQSRHEYKNNGHKMGDDHARHTRHGKKDRDRGRDPTSLGVSQNEWDAVKTSLTGVAYGLIGILGIATAQKASTGKHRTTERRRNEPSTPSKNQNHKRR